MNTKHTTGPVVHYFEDSGHGEEHTVTTYDRSRLIANVLGQDADENADLIAEAFNVAYEVGLTPRQLLDLADEREEERAELLAICHELGAALAQDTGIPLVQCVGGPFKNYRRFIDKAEAK